MRKNDLKLSILFGAIAAVYLWLMGTVGVFPGESARLAVAINAIEPSSGASPLFMLLAKATSATLIVPWLSGVLSVMAIYLITACFIRFRFDRKSPNLNRAVFLSRLGGSVAAIVLLFSPALVDSSTRLNAASFELLLALMTILATVYFYMSSARAGKWYILLTAMLTAAGLIESASFFWLSPLLTVVVYCAARARRGRFPWQEMSLYIIAVFMLYLLGSAKFGMGPIVTLRRAVGFFAHCHGVKGWLFPLAFTAVPALMLLHASKQTFGEKDSGAAIRFSHIGFTLLLALGMFTPFSPYAIMSPAGVVPTLLSAAAAVAAGYLVDWWLMSFKGIVSRVVLTSMGLILVIFSVMTMVELNPHRGEWADLAAKRVIQDLKGRTWLISDGLLDDHLLLRLRQIDEPIHLVSLRRDLDQQYLERLAAEVAKSGIGGERNRELVLSVKLGVLPFVRALLALPGAEEKVALFASPDLWYGASREPVPELLLVGAGKECAYSDAEYLELPESMLNNPVICRRLSLCANNRGVYLEDHQQSDAAWSAYRRALTLWPDNLSALMNCYGMARAGYPAAKAHLKEYEQRLEKIANDKKQRYDVWRLSMICGYIRNAEAYVRLGYEWARSGRSGEALAQLTRAIDLVPEVGGRLMNIMASLYAQERDAKASRAVYQKILAEDQGNHDALVGMMRLELQDGRTDMAAGYLERAAAVAGGGKLGSVERAVAMFVRGEREQAEELLKQVTQEQGTDARTWSLRAAAVLAELESARDEKERRRLRAKLEVDVLRPMETVAVGEDQYYYLVVKAFADMNGNLKERREAREALSKAALMRPSVRDIHEKLIALDIALGDAAAAEAHARNALRIDADIAIANYALGSIALGKNELETAEGFLRKAVETANPLAVALNDLAETCRQREKYAEAVECAQRATETAGEMHEVWDTLALSLLESGGDPERAEKAAAKSVELSKRNGRKADLRSMLTLARIQFKRGEKEAAKHTVGRIQPRMKELGQADRGIFEELRKNVR